MNKLGPNEHKVDCARAYASCIGTQKTGTDIMLSISERSDAGNYTFHDFFMDLDAAARLAVELNERIAQVRQARLLGQGK